MAVNRKFRRIGEAFRKGGVISVGQELASYRKRANERAKYRELLLREKLIFHDADFQSLINKLDHKPLISIIVPVYNVDEKWLRLCIGSVQKQVYTSWQLCIADDGSTDDHIRPVLQEYADADDRIDIVFRPVNGHISAASNSALKLANGEFCVLLDHDDELSADALYWVVNELNDHPDVKMIYSDEDLIDEKGIRYEPKFKPDFARDLFYSMNMVTHLSAYQTQLLNDIGGFREGLEGSQDYDLALRVIEKIHEKQIRHIPLILYHWRAISTSVAFSGTAKPYAYEKARQALLEHFDRTKTAAKVSAARNELNRVSYPVEEDTSVALILIGEGDLAFPSGVEIIECRKFKAFDLNKAAQKARSDILIFADASLEPVTENWLKELTSFASRPEVGAVGGKIVGRNGAVIHAGYVLNQEKLVANAHEGYLSHDPGYFFRLGLIGNYSAVSARCMAIRRKTFLSAGGFDAENMPTKYFDVDLCLRLGSQGLRIVYTPYAEFVEIESQISTKDDASQQSYFEKKWEALLQHDPFYNPNLSQTKIFSIQS